LALGIERLKTDTLDPSVEPAQSHGPARKQTLEILTDVKALHMSCTLQGWNILASQRSEQFLAKEFGERKRVGIDFRSDGLPAPYIRDFALPLPRATGKP